jgi:putative ABC transport system permease protein
MVSFPTVVFAGDESALTTLLAVTDDYPLRGVVRISDALFSEQREADRIPAPGEVWADSALLARVGADVGDTLSVGEAELRIAAVVTYRPDQSIGFASLAPTLLMNVADLEATALIGVGSRVRYALLIAGDEESVSDFNNAIEDQLPDSLRLSSAEESSERAYAAADRAKRFLSLTAVISLLLSAVAISMSARRFAHRRMDTVALMKSLGATQGFVVSVAIAQLIALGIIGVAAGSVVGFAAEEVLSWILADIIRGDLPDPGPMPIVLASGSAMVLLVGFALPSLIQLRNTPPLRVLRHDAMPPAPSRILVGGFSMAAVAALLYRSVGDPTMLVIVLGGIIVIAGALYLVGRGLVSAMGRFRSGVGVAWRYGLANVARRGRASAVQVVAFGLGLTVLLLLTLVRTDLLDGWRQTLDQDAPNHFLINIQRSETESVTNIFESRGVNAPDYAPLVRARMTLINGESVKDREYPVEDAQWFVNREQNLSWAEELSSSNELLQGEWWPPDYDGPPLVSIEEEVHQLGFVHAQLLPGAVPGRAGRLPGDIHRQHARRGQSENSARGPGARASDDLGDRSRFDPAAGAQHHRESLAGRAGRVLFHACGRDRRAVCCGAVDDRRAPFRERHARGGNPGVGRRVDPRGRSRHAAVRPAVYLQPAAVGGRRGCRAAGRLCQRLLCRTQRHQLGAG